VHSSTMQLALLVSDVTPADTYSSSLLCGVTFVQVISNNERF
jgi:hypothetical protein